jgi:hypothetical protein
MIWFFGRAGHSGAHERKDAEEPESALNFMAVGTTIKLISKAARGNC